MKLYILQERHYLGSGRVVFVTEDLGKLKRVICEKYKVDKDELKLFIEWKEYYNVFTDIALFYEEVETDTYIELPY